MQMHRWAHRAALTRAVLLVVVALAAAACTIRLAPDYDPSIVDGLTKVNEDSLVFFAAVAGGSTKADYAAKHEATYNTLIGHIEALRLQAQARPEPPPPAILSWFESRLPPDKKLPQIKTPTPEILANMVTTMTDLRTLHQRDRGISASDALNAKLAFEQEMDQALTYEKALKR